MTAIAQDRTGISIDQEALDELKQISSSKAVDEVKNQMSGLTEKRIEYHMNGLNLCTIVRVQGKVVEIQGGLIDHPIVNRLAK